MTDYPALEAYREFVTDSIRKTVRWANAPWHEQRAIDLADAALAEQQEYAESLKTCGACHHCATGAGSGTRCYAKTPYQYTILGSRRCLHEPSLFEPRRP